MLHSPVMLSLSLALPLCRSVRRCRSSFRPPQPEKDNFLGLRVPDCAAMFTRPYERYIRL